MNNSSKEYRAECVKIRAWKSATARLAIVYGLIALYAAVMVPFIPFDGSATMINDTQNAGFIIAVLTSFSCLLLGILIVARLRKFGNGAIFTLHTIYFLFLLIYSTLTIIARIIENYEIYDVMYFYAIFTDVAFGTGFVFIQIAQLANPKLHVNKTKTFYFISTILAAGAVVGLTFLADYFMGLGYKPYASSSSFGVLYKLIFLFSGVYGAINWFIVALPVNDFMQPFGGKFYRKKTADGKIPFWPNIAFGVILIAETIYFFFVGYYVLFYSMLIGVMLTAGLLLWAILYNKGYQRKVDEKLRVEREEEKRRAEENEKMLAAERQRLEGEKLNPETPERARAEEKEHIVREYDDGDPEYLVKASALLRTDAAVCDPYWDFKAFIGAFNRKMKNRGVSLTDSDTATLVSAFASSRLIFVSGIAPSLVKSFMEALSESFDTDLFIEKYYDKFIYKPEYEEVVIYKKPTAVPAETVLSGLNGESGDGQNAENQSESELSDGAQEPVKDENVSQAPVPVVVKKEKPFLRTEHVISTNKRHGIVSGVFTANCLGHFIQTVFFDETEKGFTASQKAFFRAVSAGERFVKVGDHDYLPQTEFYFSEKIAIPDNLWAICFVDENNFKKAAEEHEYRFGSFLNISPVITENTVLTEDGEFLSYEGIADNIEETEDDNYLFEESWKKIDKLVQAVKLPSEFAFDNRFIRQAEIYSSVQKAAGKTEEEVLDNLLACKILPYFAAYNELFEDTDWPDIIGNVFGIENVPLSRKAIVDLGLGARRRENDN